MEWNEIQKLVSDNRDQFDSESPSLNHMERFNSKLERRFKSAQSWFEIRWMAASVAMVIVAVGIMFNLYIHPYTGRTVNPMVSATTIELNETEVFYKEQIDKRLAELNQLNFPDPQQKSAVLKEIAAMDQNYKQLKNELDKNPDDERLINGIVEHYQVKLETISHVINSLMYCQTNSKINSHEQNI